MSVSFEGLGLSADLQDTMTRLTRVGARLARIIARNGIEGNLAEAAGTNAGGDGQKALDLIADDAFMAELNSGAVRYYASEEQDEVSISARARWASRLIRWTVRQIST